MELMLNANEEQSVEECMMRSVDGMSEEERLNTALQVIHHGVESEKRTQEVMMKV